MNNTRKCDFLIFGSSGLLGLNLSAYLGDKYEIYHGYNNREPLYKKNICKLNLNYSIDNLIQCINLINPKYIINAAGITNIEFCEVNKDLAYNANVLGAVNLAIACKVSKKKYIHFSTDHLFNGEESFSNEMKAPNPLNYYAKTKLLAEESVLRVNADALVIRTNFFGWGPTYRYSFSDFIIKSLRNNIKIKLFDDVYFTPILIENLAEILLVLLKLNASGLYNIGGKDRLSKSSFGLNICEKFSLNRNLISQISIDEYKNLIKRPKDMSLDTKKLENLIGYKTDNICSMLERLREQELMDSYRKIISL